MWIFEVTRAGSEVAQSARKLSSKVAESPSKRDSAGRRVK